MRNKICESIRQKIITLEYAPGYKLNEQKLAHKFGVSRTPVREALLLLNSEGLVSMAPNTVTQVSEIKFHKFRELTELRLILEDGAARLAAKNRTTEQMSSLEVLAEKIRETDRSDVKQMMLLDTEFHRIIRMAANNESLSQQLNLITNQFTRVMYLLSLKPTLIAKDINKIITSIKAHDQEITATLMKRHVVYFMNLVRDKINQGLGIEDINL